MILSLSIGERPRSAEMGLVHFVEAERGAAEWALQREDQTRREALNASG